MPRYILRRLLLLIPVILGVSFLTFILMRIIPGDIVTNMMGVSAANNAEVRLKVLAELGLDRPILEQYVWWLGRIFQGDFGYSFIHGGPVIDQILLRLPITLQLGVMSMMIAILMGVPLGVLSAVKRGTAIDFSSRLFSLLGISTPNFFTGTLIVVFGAIYFPSIATLGYVPFFEDPLASVSRMIWPALALGLGVGAIILRYTRSSVLEVLGEDYVRTARAKGLSETAVLFVHALKSALIPIITAIGIWSAYLVSGAVILEEVFAIPGLGRLVLSAIENRDYPIIQGTVLFLSLGVALVILVADLLVAFVDPRVKLA
ncbi:MAG: ABC transporter permease [Alphaproteobacteria bacterium]|nr:ABC transporter permease [Alphaproteobacteria bacterium]